MIKLNYMSALSITTNIVQPKVKLIPTKESDKEQRTIFNYFEHRLFCYLDFFILQQLKAFKNAIKLKNTFSYDFKFTYMLALKKAILDEFSTRSRENQTALLLKIDNAPTHWSKPLRALLVETDLCARKATAWLFRQLNCIVDIATNGHSAVEHFQQHDYDLILLDSNLLDISIKAIARQIRLLEENHDNYTTIIALITNVNNHDQGLADIDKTIAKPLTKKVAQEILAFVKHNRPKKS